VHCDFTIGSNYVVRVKISVFFLWGVCVCGGLVVVVITKYVYFYPNKKHILANNLEFFAEENELFIKERFVVCKF
jgi:hypothetical protein